MRISDWSSDVCSSDLLTNRRHAPRGTMSALSYSVALVYGRGHPGFSSLHWFFAGFLAAVARPAPYSPLCPLNGCAEALMTEDPLVLFDVWLAEASEIGRAHV